MRYLLLTVVFFVLGFQHGGAVERCRAAKAAELAAKACPLPQAVPCTCECGSPDCACFGNLEVLSPEQVEYAGKMPGHCCLENDE